MRAVLYLCVLLGLSSIAQAQNKKSKNTNSFDFALKTYYKFPSVVNFEAIKQAAGIEGCSLDNANPSPYFIEHFTGDSSGVVRDGGARSLYQMVFDGVGAKATETSEGLRLADQHKVTLRFTYDRVLVPTVEELNTKTKYKGRYRKAENGKHILDGVVVEPGTKFCGFEVFVHDATDQQIKGFALAFDGSLLEEVPEFLANDKEGNKIVDTDVETVRSGGGCLSCHPSVSERTEGFEDFWNPKRSPEGFLFRFVKIPGHPMAAVIKMLCKHSAGKTKVHKYMGIEDFEFDGMISRYSQHDFCFSSCEITVANEKNRKRVLPLVSGGISGDKGSRGVLGSSDRADSLCRNNFRPNDSTALCWVRDRNENSPNCRRLGVRCGENVAFKDGFLEQVLAIRTHSRRTPALDCPTDL